jgi:hypothetical protein
MRNMFDRTFFANWHQPLLNKSVEAWFLDQFLNSPHLKNDRLPTPIFPAPRAFPVPMPSSRWMAISWGQAILGQKNTIRESARPINFYHWEASDRDHLSLCAFLAEGQAGVFADC